MISSRKDHIYDDFIIREMERIGLLIGKVLGKENIQNNFEQAITDICRGLPFTENNLLSSSYDELIKMMIPENGFNLTNIVSLADVFAKVSDSKQHIRKALDLYKIAEKQSAAFSFSLHPKIKAMQQLAQHFD